MLATNADTAPEPQPTSTQINGLQRHKQHCTNLLTLATTALLRTMCVKLLKEIQNSKTNSNANIAELSVAQNSKITDII